MTSEEIFFIKNAQREFKDRFGKKLEIDFSSMLGEVPIKNLRNEGTSSITFPEKEVHELLDKLLKKHNTTLETVRSLRKIGQTSHPNEIRFIKEYSIIARNNKWNTGKCGALINKDRTSLLNHARIKYYKWGHKDITEQSLNVINEYKMLEMSKKN